MWIFLRLSKKVGLFLVPAEKYGNFWVFGVFCRVGGWFVVSWFLTKELKTHLIGPFFASQDIRWVCPHENKGGPCGGGVNVGMVAT